MTRFARVEFLPAPDHGDISAVLDRKADEDATAVREFAGNHRIADSVIGFHAQQAIEKWLKAVIAATGRKVERTHDLDLLIEKARDAGRELPVDADRVTALIQYAVPFRYDDLLNSDPLDRDDAVALVESVGVWARGWLARS
jgi:HEPN domain-containing protein